MAKNLDIKKFQTTIGGKKTSLYFLENRHGVRAAITNYGARIAAIWMPDRSGEMDNVAAGYDSISGYLEHDEICLGAAIGRYANRIKSAAFNLGDKEYQLTANDGDNQLHGGFKGFHNQVWDAEKHQKNELKLTLFSEDGSEGYPGNLSAEVVYRLLDDDQLIIEYRAESDADTIINVTNHTYFNMGGETGKTHVRSHQVMINANYYLPVYNDLIPVGELAEVENTPFDFRKERGMRERIENNHPQLRRGEAYDHNFVLNKEIDGAFTLAATAYDAESGRKLRVKTTEPGMQFYECEFIEELDLKMGSAFCFETQHFPDAPHHPHFPSTVLKAGEEFYSKSSFTFTVEG